MENYNENTKLDYPESIEGPKFEISVPYEVKYKDHGNGIINCWIPGYDMHWHVKKIEDIEIHAKAMMKCWTHWAMEKQLERDKKADEEFKAKRAEDPNYGKSELAFYLESDKNSEFPLQTRIQMYLDSKKKGVDI